MRYVPFQNSYFFRKVDFFVPVLVSVQSVQDVENWMFATLACGSDVETFIVQK